MRHHQIKKLIAKVEQIQTLLPKESQAFEDNEAEQLSLRSTVSTLSGRLAQLKCVLSDLESQLQKNPKSDFLLYKSQQLSDELEALTRTILLQKSSSKPKKTTKALKNQKYIPNLNQPHLELEKLRGYETKLEQQLNRLIDEGASLHQITTARERLLRCRDAIGEVSWHLKEKKQ